MNLFKILLPVTLLFAITACGDKSAEDAGERIGDAYENTKDYVEDKADSIEDKADEIGDRMKEPFQSPAEEVGEQIQDGVDELKE